MATVRHYFYTEMDKIGRMVLDGDKDALEQSLDYHGGLAKLHYWCDRTDNTTFISVPVDTSHLGCSNLHSELHKFIKVLCGYVDFSMYFGSVVNVTLELIYEFYSTRDSKRHTGVVNFIVDDWNSNLISKIDKGNPRTTEGEIKDIWFGILKCDVDNSLLNRRQKDILSNLHCSDITVFSVKIHELMNFAGLLEGKSSPERKIAIFKEILIIDKLKNS